MIDRKTQALPLCEGSVMLSLHAHVLQRLGGRLQGAGDAERVLLSCNKIQPSADPQPGAEQPRGYTKGKLGLPSP